MAFVAAQPGYTYMVGVFPSERGRFGPDIVTAAADSLIAPIPDYGVVAVAPGEVSMTVGVTTCG